MKNPPVIAVLCTDLHLQHRPPIARSGEPDWYAAMERPLAELHNAAATHGCSVIYGGDIFDTWKSPPGLINWALDKLPAGFAVPGQHDLPFHSYEDMDQSAFFTLVAARKIQLIQPSPGFSLIRTPPKCPDLYLHGFPWGFEITPLKERPAGIHLAVIHRYCWEKGSTYPDAPAAQRVGAYRGALKGYDAALFGDNHKGFLSMSGECYVLNNGGMMRRKTDEMGCRPGFGLLHADGSITRQYFDTSQDVISSAHVEEERVVADDKTAGEFLKELSALGQTKLDFREACNQYLTTYNVTPGAAKLILEAIQ